jgi:hypothetical protein
MAVRHCRLVISNGGLTAVLRKGRCSNEHFNHPTHPPLRTIFLAAAAFMQTSGFHIRYSCIKYLLQLSIFDHVARMSRRRYRGKMMKPSADHAAVPRVSTTNRSRITNGSAILEGIDGRSAPARRFRDVLAEIVNDLGGADRLSEGQRQLARRCSMLSVECEKIESEGVQGKPIDLDAYGALTDRLGRAFQRLGLKRVPRDITPTLGQILSEVRRG